MLYKLTVNKIPSGDIETIGTYKNANEMMDSIYNIFDDVRPYTAYNSDTRYVCKKKPSDEASYMVCIHTMKDSDENPIPQLPNDKAEEI